MSESNKSYSEKIEEYKQVLRKFLRQDGTVNGQGKTELRFLNENLKLDNRGIALAYNCLGYEQLNCQNRDAANILFQEAINLYEETPSAHAGWADILYSQGERKEAIKELERAKELFNKQNMSQEATQIDNYLRFINKHDTFWNRVLIALGFRNLSQNQPQSSQNRYYTVNNTYNNHIQGSSFGNFANQVMDKGRQETNQIS